MSTFIGMGANAPKKNIETELKSRIAELEKELETAIADKNKAETELKKSEKNNKDKTAKEKDKNKAETELKKSEKNNKDKTAKEKDKNKAE